jgi:hypothetical protein
VESYVIAAGGPVQPFTLTPNAMSLVVLTPLTHGEAEALPTAVSAGDTEVDIADPAASGGRLNKFVGNAVGDHVRYTLRVPRTDTYDVWLRMKKTGERGITRLDIDGAPLGAPIDGYSAGFEFVDVHAGRRTLPAGDHSLTFTLTGSSGGGYTVGVDHVELVPVHARRAELERRVPQSPSGDRIFVLADGAASGGHLVKFDSNAPGDSVATTFAVPGPGTYRLTVGVKTFPTRGICQFTVDGAPVGAPHDLYAPAASFVELPLGPVSFARAGAATIGCTVTGRNAASTGHDVALDFVTLAPTPD